MKFLVITKIGSVTDTSFRSLRTLAILAIQLAAVHDVSQRSLLTEKIAEYKA